MPDPIANPHAKAEDMPGVNHRSGSGDNRTDAQKEADSIAFVKGLNPDLNDAQVAAFRAKVAEGKDPVAHDGLPRDHRPGRIAARLDGLDK